MMSRARYFVGITLLAAGSALAAPQAPAPAAPAVPATPGPEATPGLPSPPSDFQYAPQGRRDPFVNLVNRGTDSRSLGTDEGKRPEGAAGLVTAELVVRGILLTRGTWVALVAGPDGKVFTVRAGDRLSDGVVRTITAQAVVILQEVNDPLSLDKQREVRKFLRGGEEVK